VGCVVVDKTFAADKKRVGGHFSRDGNKSGTKKICRPTCGDLETRFVADRSSDVNSFIRRIIGFVGLHNPKLEALGDRKPPLQLGWRFGVAVTRWSRSTQLLYIEPG